LFVSQTFSKIPSDQKEAGINENLKSCVSNITELKPKFTDDDRLPSDTDELINRLEEEQQDRIDIMMNDHEIPYSDMHTGKLFKTCGKEWLVGKYNTDWKETKEWVDSLGNGWRMPCHSEVDLLFKTRGRTTEIGWDMVWLIKSANDFASIDTETFECYSEPFAIGCHTRSVAIRRSCSNLFLA